MRWRSDRDAAVGRRRRAAPLVAAAALMAVPPPAGAQAPSALPTGVEPVHGPVDRLDAAGSIVSLVERRGGGIALGTDVLFDLDRAELRPAGRAAVLRTARRVARAQGTLRVVGHTDGLGTDAHNDALSLRRARAVAAALRPAVRGGVRITVAGRGERDPVADEEDAAGDDDPAARARNRRVELRFAR